MAAENTKAIKKRDIKPIKYKKKKTAIGDSRKEKTALINRGKEKTAVTERKKKKTSVIVSRKSKTAAEGASKKIAADHINKKTAVDRVKSKTAAGSGRMKAAAADSRTKKITKKDQQNTNVWDTLGIPDIKDAVKRTTDTEGFKWAVFLISIAGMVLLLLFIYIGTNVFLKHYKVETVFVEGSTHYSNDEIKEMVMDGPLGDNSLYLSFKYKNKAIENVPFVQRMDVEVIDAKSIRIRVYEKAIAGYFEHLGRYVYFDKDGIVIETSEKETKGIPLVTGLKFSYVVMYEPLPVEKKEIFEDILDITQLLHKYEILADKIYFDSDNKKTLYFGNARVSLGSNDNIDEKILKLKYILPKLEGLSGVLRMDNYSEGVTNITFEEDKK